MNTEITNYDQAESLANQIKSQASQMQGILDQISSLLDSSLGNYEIWSGDTADNVKAAFKEKYSRFHEFSDAVNASGDYVLKVVNNYRQAENAINNAAQQ